MSAEILGSDEVFQNENRQFQREQPDKIVYVYRGELSKLEAIRLAFGDRAESSTISEASGPMPTLEVTLAEFPGAEFPGEYQEAQDEAAVARSLWELFSYETTAPLRADVYYAVTAGSEEESDLNVVDDFFDRGIRDVAAGAGVLLSSVTGVNPLQTEKGKEYARDRASGLSTIPSFQYEIRQTIFAGGQTALKASFAGVREIDSPPVPESAKFSIEALGGTWLKMSPQVSSAGRGKFRIVQAWRRGNWPSKIFGGTP